MNKIKTLLVLLGVIICIPSNAMEKSPQQDLQQDQPWIDHKAINTLLENHKHNVLNFIENVNTYCDRNTQAINRLSQIQAYTCLLKNVQVGLDIIINNALDHPNAENEDPTILSENLLATIYKEFQKIYKKNIKEKMDQLKSRIRLMGTSEKKENIAEATAGINQHNAHPNNNVFENAIEQCQIYGHACQKQQSDPEKTLVKAFIGELFSPNDPLNTFGIMQNILNIITQKKIKPESQYISEEIQGALFPSVEKNLTRDKIYTDFKQIPVNSLKQAEESITNFITDMFLPKNTSKIEEYYAVNLKSEENLLPLLKAIRFINQENRVQPFQPNNEILKKTLKSINKLRTENKENIAFQILNVAYYMMLNTISYGHVPQNQKFIEKVLNNFIYNNCTQVKKPSFDISIKCIQYADQSPENKQSESQGTTTMYYLSHRDIKRLSMIPIDIITRGLRRAFMGYNNIFQQAMFQQLGAKFITIPRIQTPQTCETKEEKEEKECNLVLKALNPTNNIAKRFVKSLSTAMLYLLLKEEGYHNEISSQNQKIVKLNNAFNLQMTEKMLEYFVTTQDGIDYKKSSHKLSENNISPQELVKLNNVISAKIAEINSVRELSKNHVTQEVYKKFFDKEKNILSQNPHNHANAFVKNYQQIKDLQRIDPQFNAATMEKKLTEHYQKNQGINTYFNYCAVQNYAVQNKDEARDVCQKLRGLTERAALAQDAFIKAAIHFYQQIKREEFKKISQDLDEKKKFTNFYDTFFTKKISELWMIIATKNLLSEKIDKEGMIKSMMNIFYETLNDKQPIDLANIPACMARINHLQVLQDILTPITTGEQQEMNTQRVLDYYRQFQRSYSTTENTLDKDFQTLKKKMPKLTDHEAFIQSYMNLYGAIEFLISDIERFSNPFLQKQQEVDSLPWAKKMLEQYNFQAIENEKPQEKSRTVQ